MNRSIFQYSQVDCPCFHFSSNPSSLNSSLSLISPNISINSYRQERQSIKTGRSFQGKKSLRHLPKNQNCKQYAIKPNWTFDMNKKYEYGKIEQNKNKKCISFSYPTKTSTEFKKQNKISILQQQSQKQNKIKKLNIKSKQNVIQQQPNTQTNQKFTKTIQKSASISKFVIFLNQSNNKQNKQNLNFTQTQNSLQKTKDKKVILDELFDQKINLSALKASIEQLQSVYEDETSAVQSTVVEKGKSTWVAQSKKKLGITQFISSLHIRSKSQLKCTEIDRRTSRLSPLIKMDEA